MSIRYAQTIQITNIHQQPLISCSICQMVLVLAINIQSETLAVQKELNKFTESQTIPRVSEKMNTQLDVQVDIH